MVCAFLTSFVVDFLANKKARFCLNANDLVPRCDGDPVGTRSFVRPMKTLKAKSVRDFLRRVNQLDRKWQRKNGSSTELWFQGQTTKEIPKPRLYRGDLFRNAGAELRIEFQRRGAQFFRDRALTNRWERYFLMQHFGTPTRLLDWTDGALLGLYFARSRYCD
jgi:hypothetical protein